MVKGSINIRWRKNGVDAVRYEIIPSCTSVNKDTAGAFSPASVSANVIKAQGASVAVTTEASLYVRWSASGTWNVVTPGASIAISTSATAIEFKASVGGVDVATQSVSIVVEGEQGPQGEQGRKGAKPRFRNWDDVVDYLQGRPVRTIAFCSGEGVEEWYDVITQGATLYRCVSSYTLHGWVSTTPAANVKPSGDSTHWEEALMWGFVATDLLLSEKAFITNLCAEYIRCVKDSVVKFEVDSDGNITANGGTFTGITAEGGTFNGITANQGAFDSVSINGAFTAKSMSLQCERLTDALQFSGNVHLLTYPLTVVELDSIGVGMGGEIVLALPYLTVPNTTLSLEVLVAAAKDSSARWAKLTFAGTRQADVSAACGCLVSTCGAQDATTTAVAFQGLSTQGISILGFYKCVGYCLSRAGGGPITRWEVLRLSDGSEYVARQANALRPTADNSTTSNGNYAYNISEIQTRPMT